MGVLPDCGSYRNAHQCRRSSVSNCVIHMAPLVKPDEPMAAGKRRDPVAGRKGGNGGIKREANNNRGQPCFAHMLRRFNVKTAFGKYNTGSASKRASEQRKKLTIACVVRTAIKVMKELFCCSSMLTTSGTVVLPFPIKPMTADTHRANISVGLSRKGASMSPRTWHHIAQVSESRWSKTRWCRCWEKARAYERCKLRVF